MKDYKFTPIILKQDKDGKIEITEEKLKEMLKDAYNNGFEDGKNANPAVYPIVSPATSITPVSPTIPQPYWDWSKPYCGSCYGKTIVTIPSNFNDCVMENGHKIVKAGTSIRYDDSDYYCGFLPYDIDISNGDIIASIVTRVSNNDEKIFVTNDNYRNIYKQYLNDVMVEGKV